MISLISLCIWFVRDWFCLLCIRHVVSFLAIRMASSVLDALYLYLYKYENVCLSVRVFLGHLESDSDTLWQKVCFRPRKGPKTIKFQKKLFFAELLPFFYISLRFLCKFEERL